MRLAAMHKRPGHPSLSCHPITLAVWLCALVTILIAQSMASPSLLVLLLHLPAFALLSVVAAYWIPDRARHIVLLICGPITVLAFAVYPF
jgi:hypothetical protein